MVRSTRRAATVVALLATALAAASCGSNAPPTHEGGFFVPDEGRVVNLSRADEGRVTTLVAPAALGPAAPNLTRPNVAQIEPGHLVAPLVVIDVVERRRSSLDFTFTTEDLVEFEGRAGAIPVGAFVVLLTGGGAPERAATGHVSDARRHPGFSDAVVELLARQRAAVGFGSDAPAIDPSTAGEPLARRAALQADRFVVTNLASLDQIAGGRAIVFLGAPLSAVPEAPLRVLALAPRRVAQGSK